MKNMFGRVCKALVPNSLLFWALLISGCSENQPGTSEDSTKQPNADFIESLTTLSDEQCRIGKQRLDMQKGLSSMSPTQLKKYGLRTLEDRIAEAKAAGQYPAFFELSTINYVDPDPSKKGKPVVGNFDPWGQLIQFVVLPDTVVPVSAGPDMKFGTDDDLYCGVTK